MTAPANVLRPQLQSRTISEGTLQALKWLALLLMVLDHVNTYLLNGAHRWAYEAGRMCLPLFAFVLAYNLARPTTNADHYKRMIGRMALAGIAATPALAWLHNGSVHQLNVMFSLAICTGAIWAIEKGGATTLFGLAISLLLAVPCEGGIPLLLIVIGFWLTFARRSRLAFFLARTAVMGGFGILAMVNHSVITILPLLLLPLWPFLPKITAIPRFKYLFYIFYPAHLYAILGLSIALTK